MVIMIRPVVKKAMTFVVVTLLGSGITSTGTFVLNSLQTEDNKKIQEEINKQFIENDKAVLEILKNMEKKIQSLDLDNKNNTQEDKNEKNLHRKGIVL